MISPQNANILSNYLKNVIHPCGTEIWKICGMDLSYNKRKKENMIRQNLWKIATSDDSRKNGKKTPLPAIRCQTGKDDTIFHFYAICSVIICRTLFFCRINSSTCVRGITMTLTSTTVLQCCCKSKSRYFINYSIVISSEFISCIFFYLFLTWSCLFFF